MKRNFKIITLVLSLVIMLTMVTGCGTTNEPKPADTPKETPNEAATTDFPKNTLTGVVPFSAGGELDNVVRTASVLAEESLGETIIVQNVTGAAGAVGMQQVLDAKADGYTLFLGAENPALYGVLGVSEFGYKDFDPIIILAENVAAVIAPIDSPYNSISDVIEDAKNRPGEVTYGSTGPGGLPYTLASMFKTVSSVDFQLVTYGGGSDIVTAILGNQLDVGSLGISGALDMYRAGRLKILGTVTLEPVEGLEDVPALGQEIPDYQEMLPWGPFYGVYVKKGTPEDVRSILEDAYTEAYESDKFQEFIANMGYAGLGLTGDEAAEYVDRWQRQTTWMLYDAEMADVSPESLGIERLK